jgi:photosystem II stability/assembly factor-like uncharacterized protein
MVVLSDPNPNVISMKAEKNHSIVVASLFFLQALVVTVAASDGQGWTEQVNPGGAVLKSVFFIDSNTGWAVGGDGAAKRTINGGITWTYQRVGDRLNFECVQFVDPQTGWIVGGTFGELAVIFHTNDGGVTWASQTIDIGYPSYLYSVDFVDSLTGWAVGIYGKIVRTTDGGTTWIERMSPTGAHLHSIDFVDPKNGWAVGTGGVVIRTTNRGNTWELQDGAGASLLNSVCFTDLTTGWAAGGIVIIHTTNGGQTWLPQNSGLTSDNLESIRFTDARTGWASGTNGTIIHTTNGGMEWTTQRVTSPEETVYSLSFPDATTGWAVGVTVPPGEPLVLSTTTGGTGNDPPVPPTLDLPGDGSFVSLRPVLRWNIPQTAMWSTLQVSISPYFLTFVSNQTNSANISSQVIPLQDDTTYYWRTNLIDNSGTSGWSETRSFRATPFPNPVYLVTPFGGTVIIEDTTVLTWNETLPRVDRYWLEGSTDSLFATPLIDSLLIDTMRTVGFLEHNQRYWWRVRAHNSYGWGPFSEVRSFLVYQEIPAAPVLLSPGNGATGVSTNPTLSWGASVGTESYHLQLSDLSDFSNLIVDEDSIETISLEVKGLLNDATYYWRVNAANDFGASDWSAVWNFTTLLNGVETEQIITTGFSLSQNYPNPFNPSTIIRYSLPQRSHVKLELFTSLGQRVAVLVDSDSEPGYHSVTFGSRELASGLYFYRLRAGGFVETKKLIILR